MNWLELILTTTKDAMVSVALPVTLLLFVVAYLETAGHLNFERLFSRTKGTQPLVGAAASAIPGCAGSIALTRLYGLGSVSVGTLYAAHVATLGDAAFVLWSRRPLETFGLTLLVAAVGAGFGYFVESPLGRRLVQGDGSFTCPLPRRLPVWASASWPAGLVLSLLVALFLPSQAAVAGGIGLGVVLFGVPMLRLPDASMPQSPWLQALQSSVRDAAEILIWVVAADVLFTMANALTGGVLVTMLQGNVLVDVIIGTLIGLIPGCGPQIVVATLYVSGDIPFAVLLANTLSQHGDAIFLLLKAQRKLAAQLTIAGGVVGLVAGLIWVVFSL